MPARSCNALSAERSLPPARDCERKLTNGRFKRGAHYRYHATEASPMLTRTPPATEDGPSIPQISSRFDAQYYNECYGNYFRQNPPRKLRFYRELLQRH